MTEEWIRVCDKTALKNGDLLDFDHGEKKIMLARAGGNVFATDRICTHAYADLATGIMNGDVPAGDKTYLAQLVAPPTGLYKPMPRSGSMT